MCPNINDEQIRNEFNEIVTALGGNPLTIEEFRNKELRLQRTGTDAAAMDAAYDIWDQNQGNPIDKAPNGSESILFKSLMDYYGDRQKAIRTKANTYSQAFKNWFSDWTDPDATNVSKVVDENGEPLISEIIKNLTSYANQKFNSIEIKFKNQGLIHWYNRGKKWMITKSRYNSYEEYNSIINYIDFESIKLGFHAEFINTKNGTSVAFISEKLYDKLPKSPDYTHVSKLIAFLSQRFPGIKFGGIVSQKDAKPNQNAFVKNGVIYLVEGRFTNQIAIEECLHPFVNALYQDNADLFNSLFQQAEQEFPKLWQEIKLTYDESEYDIRQELVAQALSRTFNEEHKTNLPISFKELVNGFVEWLKGIFENLFDINDYNIINVKELPRMSLEDISKLVNTSDTFFNIEYSGNFNSISTSEIEKVNNKIKKGINQRLATIQRYQTRNIKAIQETQRLIDQLNKLDSIEGTIEFVEYVRDNIVNAFKFLNKDISEINSTQIVQLKRDYLGFFIPMMKEIQMILDTTSELKDIPDYDNFRDVVDNIINGQSTLINKYNNLLTKKTADFIRSYAEDAGSATVEQVLDWLQDPNKDLTWLEMFLGQNSSSSNEVIRIMADMLNNQINSTKRATYSEGVKLVDLYKKAKEANKGVDVMSLLQEKDKNGQTTGYFTRELNYGQFYQDLQKEYDKIAESMKLEKNSDGEYVFADREQEKEFRKRRTLAQLKLGNLKYTKEYYEEKAKLPIEAQDALDYVNSELNYLMSSVTDGNIIRWDKVTPEIGVQLDNLHRMKAELYSEYYANGEAKSGTDLLIAKSLIKMQKALKGKVGYKIDYNKWNANAAAISSKYGYDSEEYKKWYFNSTSEVYSDEFYALLDKVTTTKSEELNDLYGERNILMNMYRDADSKAIEMPIPNEIKEQIIELDKQIAELRPRTNESNENLRFSDIAEIRKTKQYYEDERVAKEEGTYEEWYAKNHFEVDGKIRTASYYTYMVPKNSKHITRKPNKFYSQVDPESAWVNSEYNPNGEYVQPKKSLYDNSAAWSKIQNNPTVKALYDALITTMKESNSKIAFAQNQNSYRLPQISGRMMATIIRSDDKWEALKYTVADQFKIKDDDTEYVDDYQYRPDGSEIKLVPTRFMRMLDDPKMITSDVVGSVIQYFEMAENYKNMSAIQNDLEMIMYRLEQLDVQSGQKIKQGKASRVYQKAATLLDMGLYGRKKEQIKVGKYNISKGLNKVYNYISLSNLSQNVWAMSANYVTGQGTLDMESIAGKYFDISDIVFAKKEFLQHFGHITANIGNVNDKDKLVMMMQMNQVTRSNQETFDRLDQSAALRAINQHFWYNGYTAGDFTIKSQLLMAVYHSYKYVDGQYMTKEQYIAKYYASDRKKGSEEFKKIKEILWDAYDVVNGELIVVKNKEAVAKIQSKITNKINTIAARIDGNIQDTDRTQIHQNAITQFFAMHRNFLISGFQERVKAKQFNYSTGQMEGGMYSDAFKFIKHGFSKGKLKVITQLIADYKNLDELEKYNVRKVYMDLMNIALWSMVISTLFVAAADDDPDNYLLQALAYASTRISFEFRTLYNPIEVTNLFNSPSAAISSLENAFNYIKLVFPGTYFYESNMFSSIKTGVYKGWPKILRNTVKLTPLKNIIEATDVKGIKSKRNYLENQMMF